MTIAQIYLPSVLALVALSFLVALAILITRFTDLYMNKRPLAYYEDFSESGATIAVIRPTRQLANLFEFPVLFYALITIAIATGLKDALLPILCWVYVGLRWLHAISHICFNKLWLRTPIFMVGNLLLLGMWVRLALDVLG
jgi:hypothetical protein